MVSPSPPSFQSTPIEEKFSAKMRAASAAFVAVARRAGQSGACQPEPAKPAIVWAWTTTHAHRWASTVAAIDSSAVREKSVYVVNVSKL
jgi:hypothetical protein